MFALYTTERNWLGLRSDLRLGAPVVGTVGWAAFEVLAPAAWCCLVALPEPPRAELIQHVIQFAAARPYTPLVLITGRRPARALAGRVVTVGPPLTPGRLLAAIEEACVRRLLAEAADRWAAARGVQTLVRRALAAVFAADPPLGSVTAVSAALATSPRALTRAWAGHAQEPRIGGASGTPDGVGAPPLARALDWGLLLRATASRQGETNWNAVSARVGVHRHTLARVAQTLAACSLRELTPEAGPALRAGFAREVLGPLGPRADLEGAGHLATPVPSPSPPHVR